MNLHDVLAIWPTLAIFTGLLTWALIRCAVSGTAGAERVWDQLGVLAGSRTAGIFLFIVAVVYVLLSVLMGYLNPRDYVQDFIAARQFLQHSSMYPADMPEKGVAALSAPIGGLTVLRHIPVVRGELNTLREIPVLANAHPPLSGILLAAPVFFLGLRGSFVLMVLISCVAFYAAFRALLRELFPHLPNAAAWTLLALAFAWYPVDTTLRSGQDSLLLFALIVAAWLMLRRNRPWLAGAPIALAAWLHVFPGMIGLLFAVRSRRALFSAALTGGILGLAVAGLAGPEALREWLSTANANAQLFVPRPGNISLAGLAMGLSKALGPAIPVKAAVATGLLFVATGLAIFLWRQRRTGEPAAARLDREYSAFVAAALLVSPISWDRYLPVLILPVAVLIRNWKQSRPWWAAPALLAVLVLTSLSDSTSERLSGLLAQAAGPLGGWLIMALPTFAILAILLWLTLPGARSRAGEPQSSTR